MSTEKIYHEGLLGKKLGMTQVFTDDGKCVPVTALEVGPCYVLQVMNPEKSGYSAVQLGFGERKERWQSVRVMTDTIMRESKVHAIQQLK